MSYRVSKYGCEFEVVSDSENGELIVNHIDATPASKEAKEFGDFFRTDAKVFYLPDDDVWGVKGMGYLAGNLSERLPRYEDAVDAAIDWLARDYECYKYAQC